MDKLLLTQDSSVASVDYVFKRLLSGRAPRNTNVLVLAGLTNFNDQHMEVLMKILKKFPSIFPVNLGEKCKVTNFGWDLLINNIRSGEIGIRYGFVDTKDCNKVRVIKNVMQEQRRVDLSFPNAKPKWQCALILEELRKENPISQRNDIDLAYGKPFWYSKPK